MDTNKKRGSRTHGRGHKKKARGAGSRGGRGQSGLLKHKKFKMFKECPNHFGKRGFKSLKQKGFKNHVAAINLNDLMRLAEGKEIDVTTLGYQKVLGAGNVSVAITVKAKMFSEKAKQKIEKAGGQAVQV
ncbi:MAG: uL15m family ribosomal protein [Candidatus Aenigmatarchaeota archaeon]